MIYKKVEFDIDYARIGVEPPAKKPVLTCYCPDLRCGEQNNRPSIVICPGGSYVFTSEREGEPIAHTFLQKGFNAFVLWYSCAPTVFPAALCELSAAVAYVRNNAERFHADPNKIITNGYSAGGHLVASHGTLWNRDFIKEPMGYKNCENKPNGMILCYPVITTGIRTHGDSIKFLLGEARKDDPEMRLLVSCEKQVSADTPPAFLWHTADDSVVPVENSILMAQSLAAAGIAFELHVYPTGVHGLSLCNNLTGDCGEQYLKPEYENWVDMAARFVKKL